MFLRPPFSSSEIARIAALLRLSPAVAGDAHALEGAGRDRVGPRSRPASTGLVPPGGHSTS